MRKMLTVRCSGLAGLVVAAAVAVSAPGSVAAAETVYRLGPGDRIYFSVITADGVEREAEIGIDGGVFLPFLGAVQAGGKTLKEFRAGIAEQLRGAPIRLPATSGDKEWRALQPNEIVIDVSEYRPVYVSGDVERVGEIPFRPGMTVRHALTNAGGMRLINDADDIRMVELMTRREMLGERVAVLSTRLAQYEANMRLIDEDTGEAAPAASQGEGATEAADATDNQWIESREAVRLGNKQSLESQLEQMDQRLSVLRELEVVSAQTLELEEDNFERVKDLASRGVATTNALNDARRDLLQTSSRVLETSEDVYQLQVLMTKSREQVDLGDLETKAELVELMQTVTDDLSVARAQYEVLSSYLATIGASGSSASDVSVLIQLHRSDDSEQSKRFVEADEPVMPGDVLEVSLVPQELN